MEGMAPDLPSLARDAAELAVLKRAWERAHRLYQRKLDAGERPVLNAASWEPEQQLRGKYTVVRRLGCGGMGEVYLVRRNRDGRELAAKRVRDPDDGGVFDPLKYLDGQRQRQAAMLEEIMQSMELPEGPHVLRCQFMDVIDGGLVLFTEHARHGSVADCLVRGLLYGDGTIRDRFNELAWQILSGLAHLHDSQVVHQDIKPENVLITDLDYGLHVRIADFGVARPLTQNPGGQPRAPLAGLDHRYASPEQLAGHTLTATSDVYSWALTMLASAPDTDYRQSLVQLKSNREQFIVDRLAFLAEAQGTVVTTHLQRALAPDPQARPSAYELLEVFQPLTDKQDMLLCELSLDMANLLDADTDESDRDDNVRLLSRLAFDAELPRQRKPWSTATPREQLFALLSREILDRTIQDSDLEMDEDSVQFLRSIYAGDGG